MPKQYGRHNQRPKGLPLRQAFEWFEPIQEGDCLLWPAGITKSGGYGAFLWRGRPVRVHQVAYRLAHGEIPDGQTIDHSCNNRRCVNPDHLRLATPKQQAENRSGARSDNKSGVRGVHLVQNGQVYRVRVGHNGRVIHVGYFRDLQQAEAAAVAKRLELFTHNERDRKVG